MKYRHPAAAIALGLAALLLTTAADKAPVSVPAASCDASGGSSLAATANATDPKTGRKFFLEYPCDLKKGEKLTFILSIHGAGSINSWQRLYFPARDYKEKYRLVIATPSAVTATPIRMWSDVDDAHLQNISDIVFEQFGKKNIKSFWLAGHSQGGMTSNRIVCTPYFRGKVDGWLSLSGGRLGPVTVSPDFFSGAALPNLGSGANAVRPGIATAPDCDFSYIFTTGEHEITGLPETSPWADKYGCKARVRRPDIVDAEKGYVTGASPGRPASWGQAARPGTANEYVYPGCKGRRLVADVVRLDKGHTEGLEPKVTEALIRQMTSAPGGKAQKG